MRVFGRTRRVVAKAVTGDAFLVLERRLFEQRLNAVARCLTGQRLIEQPWSIRRIAGPHRLQVRQQQTRRQQHAEHAVVQALAQTAEDQFNVPGFELRAAVQVQAETAGDIHRSPGHQDQRIKNVGQVLQPAPVLIGGEQQ